MQHQSQIPKVSTARLAFLFRFREVRISNVSEHQVSWFSFSLSSLTTNRGMVGHFLETKLDRVPSRPLQPIIHIYRNFRCYTAHAFGEVSLNMPRINKSEAEYDKYKDGIRVVLTS